MLQSKINFKNWFNISTMRKYLHCVIWVLSLFVLLSCDNSNYKKIIPVDATFVASINLDEIADKSDFTNSSIFSLIKRDVESIIPSESKDDILSYFESPEKLGLDFSDNVYVFMTPNRCLGITIKVHDSNAVEHFLSLFGDLGLAGNIVERDGLMWSSLIEDFDVVYNDKTFLMLCSLNEGGSAISKQTANYLFSIGEDQMFVNSEDYKVNFLELSDDIALSANLELIPSLDDYLDIFLSENIDSKEVRLFSTVNFEDGKIVCNSKFNAETERCNQLLDNVDSHFKDIEGRYVDSPVDSFLVWSCLGVDGNWMLKTLKSDPEIKQSMFLLGRAIDIDMMIRSINGDCALIIPHTLMTNESDNIDFSIIGTLSEKKFLDDVDYWMESMTDYGMSMDNIGDNQYVLKANDFKFNWGVDDDNIYFTSENAYHRFAFSKRSDLLIKHEESIRKSKMYTYINLKTLPLNEISNVLGLSVPNGEKILDSLDALIISSKSIRDFKVELIMNNKEENVLKSILN